MRRPDTWDETFAKLLLCAAGFLLLWVLDAVF